MNDMLEKPMNTEDTQRGENSQLGPISRKESWIAWLAGIIEGEGCISARWCLQTNPRHYGDNRISTIVTVYNTNPLLIQKVAEILKENSIPFCVTLNRRKRSGESPGMSVLVEGNGRVIKILNLIMPYLVGKKRQAELMLDLIQHRESLAINYAKIKGRFGNLKLRDDVKICSLIEQIKIEKRNFSVLEYSRKPNEVPRKSSETLCSPAPQG